MKYIALITMAMAAFVAANAEPAADSNAGVRARNGGAVLERPALEPRCLGPGNLCHVSSDCCDPADCVCSIWSPQYCVCAKSKEGEANEDVVKEEREARVPAPVALPAALDKRCIPQGQVCQATEQCCDCCECRRDLWNPSIGVCAKK